MRKIDKNKLQNFKKYCMKRFHEERENINEKEMNKFVEYISEKLATEYNLGYILQAVADIDRYMHEFEDLEENI